VICKSSVFMGLGAEQVLIDEFRRSIICGTRQRRGEIYLEGEDTFLIVEKPFYLQHAPPPRYQPSNDRE